MDLATVRVGRHGGPTPIDLAFRQELFVIVGSVTVAGAHIEAALKRLLLVMSGMGSEFSRVDLVWADLEKKLRKRCSSDSTRERELLVLLDWADKYRLREGRHTAVHGSWWIYAGVGARVSRWPRKSDDRTQIGTLEGLRTLADRCWSYAQRLDDLIGEDWSRAMLPAPSIPEAFKRPREEAASEPGPNSRTPQS